MSRFRLFLFIALAALPAFSCESEVREAIVNQEKYIDDYINSKYADSEVYRDGSVSRIVLSAGAPGAPAIEKGDSVYFYFAGFCFSQGGPSSQFVLDSAMFRVGSGDLIRGLDMGLIGARLGEEALILFTSQYGYGTDAVGLVPENTALLFDVAVAAIKKKQ